MVNCVHPSNKCFSVESTSVKSRLYGPAVFSKELIFIRPLLSSFLRPHDIERFWGKGFSIPVCSAPTMQVDIMCPFRPVYEQGSFVPAGLPLPWPPSKGQFWIPCSAVWAQVAAKRKKEDYYILIYSRDIKRRCSTKASIYIHIMVQKAVGDWSWGGTGGKGRRVPFLRGSWGTVDNPHNVQRWNFWYV